MFPLADDDGSYVGEVVMVGKVNLFETVGAELSVGIELVEGDDVGFDDVVGFRLIVGIKLKEGDSDGIEGLYVGEPKVGATEAESLLAEG